VQPVSQFSAAARAIFSSIAKAWGGTLNDTQRAAWLAWAQAYPITNVFGDSLTLSGIAAFQSVNRMVLQCGGSIVLTPPAPEPLPLPGVTNPPVVTVVSGALTALSLYLMSLTAPQVLYMFATPPLSPSVTVQKTDYRLLNTGINPDMSTAAAQLAAYNLRFPTATHKSGLVIYARARVVDLTTGADGGPAVAQGTEA
jgi:hypothetical protein